MSQDFTTSCNGYDDGSQIEFCLLITDNVLVYVGDDIV